MRSGAVEVLEPMQAQVVQVGVVDQLRGGGTDQDLAAVAGGGDAGGAVDVGPDVALVGQQRGAGVEADADPDRSPRPGRRVRLGRRGQRAGRGREGDEEGVALGVDLDPAVAREGVAHDAAVLGQRIGVRFGAECMEQLRRALHVGEEEGDRAGRELAHAGDLAAFGPSLAPGSRGARSILPTLRLAVERIRSPSSLAPLRLRPNAQWSGL